MKFESITADIVRLLEEGTKPWTKTWKSRSFVPYNASTNEQYRGVNILLLWASAMRRDFPQHAWMGFGQARTLGAHVRKGEKASRVVFFNWVEEGDKKVPYSRIFNVFNVAQLENLPEKFTIEPEPIPQTETMNVFNELLKVSGIVHRLGPTPVYYPALDVIEMPPFSDFTGEHREADWISSFGHEVIHATAAPSRLNRKFDGEDRYGWEELTAELGAAFICSSLNVSYRDAQSPAYLAGWLKVLKQDARALFTIASQASKAADWFLERQHAVTETTPDCEKAPRQEGTKVAA